MTRRFPMPRGQELADKITLIPQKSEVKDVKWINCNEKLYGGHKKFIDMVKEKMDYEKLMDAAPYNEPINMQNFNDIGSVFVYLVIVLFSIYYALQLREEIQKEEKNITMFVCDYDICHTLLFGNTYAIPFNTTS